MTTTSRMAPQHKAIDRISGFCIISLLWKVGTGILHRVGVSVWKEKEGTC